MKNPRMRIRKSIQDIYSVCVIAEVPDKWILNTKKGYAIIAQPFVSKRDQQVQLIPVKSAACAQSSAPEIHRQMLQPRIADHRGNRIAAHLAG
ncbi:hypothetical protein L3V59_01930 [Burkholderia aenigmatica]|uniref:hypothetical protein n=1 Tax=Burkholderia aenigmatica TaxID=2015348 RepID=UPI001F391D89|nr:hypothetical protein [Burkholderia aenigmatica]UKD11856.1 hypothetical protein L3V59_01930 [Burkholderia aenigmatica]